MISLSWNRSRKNNLEHILEGTWFVTKETKIIETLRNDNIQSEAEVQQKSWNLHGFCAFGTQCTTWKMLWNFQYTSMGLEAFWKQWSTDISAFSTVSNLWPELKWMILIYAAWTNVFEWQMLKFQICLKSNNSIYCGNNRTKMCICLQPHC